MCAKSLKVLVAPCRGRTYDQSIKGLSHSSVDVAQAEEPQPRFRRGYRNRYPTETHTQPVRRPYRPAHALVSVRPAGW